jgi:tetratricopeptide (TPR) repeat protein
MYVDYHQPGTSDVMQLCFAARNTPKGSFGFYKTDCEESVSKVMLNCPNNWYLEGIEGFSESADDTTAKLREIKARLNPRRSFAVGSSMGAYGAILHAAAAGLDAVLAFGAELVTGLPGGYSGQFILPTQQETRRRLDLAIKDTPTFHYVYAGEYSPPDLYALGKTRGMPNVRAAVVAGEGHAVVKGLKDRDVLRRLLTCVAEGGDPAGLAEEMDDERMEAVLSHYPADLPPERFIDAAKAHFCASLKNEPYAAREFISFFKKVREYDYLLAALEELRLPPTETLELKAFCYMKLRRFDESVAAAVELIRVQKGNVLALYYLSYSYGKLGLTEVGKGYARQAIKMLEKAKASEKAMQPYRYHLTTLEAA